MRGCTSWARLNKVLSASREQISEHAPSMTVIHVSKDKIRDIIGKGRRDHSLHRR